MQFINVYFLVFVVSARDAKRIALDARIDVFRDEEHIMVSRSRCATQDFIAHYFLGGAALNHQSVRSLGSYHLFGGNAVA